MNISSLEVVNKEVYFLLHLFLVANAIFYIDRRLGFIPNTEKNPITLIFTKMFRADEKKMYAGSLSLIFGYTTLVWVFIASMPFLFNKSTHFVFFIYPLFLITGAILYSFYVGSFNSSFDLWEIEVRKKILFFVPVFLFANLSLGIFQDSLLKIESNITPPALMFVGSIIIVVGTIFLLRSYPFNLVDTERNYLKEKFFLPAKFLKLLFDSVAWTALVFVLTNGSYIFTDYFKSWPARIVLVIGVYFSISLLRFSIGRFRLSRNSFLFLPWLILIINWVIVFLFFYLGDRL